MFRIFCLFKSKNVRSLGFIIILSFIYPINGHITNVLLMRRQIKCCENNVVKIPVLFVSDSEDKLRQHSVKYHWTPWFYQCHQILNKLLPGMLVYCCLLAGPSSLSSNKNRKKQKGKMLSKWFLIRNN